MDHFRFKFLIGHYREGSDWTITESWSDQVWEGASQTVGIFLENES